MPSSESGLVSCNGIDCNICNILETISAIFNWLLAVSFAAAVLMLVIGGFFLISSRGKKLTQSKAKYFIQTVLKGFGLVLLAWIIIHALLTVIGNNKSWWQFECSSTDSNSVLTVNSIQEALRSSKQGEGEVGAQLQENTSSQNVLDVYESLSEEELLVFNTLENNQLDTWAILGKKNGVEEIFYLDVTKIEAALSKKESFSPINIARAQLDIPNLPDLENSINSLDEKGSEQGIREVARAISQLIFAFAEGRTDQVVFLITRPENLTIDSSQITQRIPGEISASIEKAKQCLLSQGQWRRFANSCSFKKALNPEEKCDPAKDSIPVDGCLNLTN